MSQEPEADDMIATSADGIHVRKRFSAEEFPVPAIEFTLHSERDEAVEVRLEDSIPESFPMDRVGFHPDYESDNWTAYQDHRVEYRRRFEPGEEVTTVYGIRTDDPEEGKKFLDEPTVEIVGPDESGGAERDSAEVVQEPMGTEHQERDASIEAPGPEIEAEPGAVADAVPDPSTTQGPASGPDPRTVRDDTTSAVAVRRETGAVNGSAGTGTDADSGTGPDVEASDSVAAALAEEIREGRVSDEDLDILKEGLELGRVGHTTSVDARISRLQSRVEDLAAYSDALAEFIDENGSAQEVIDRLEADFERIQDTVGSFEDRLDAAETERGDLSSEMETLEEGLDSVETALDALEEDIRSVHRDVAELDRDHTALSEEVSTLDGDIDALTEEVTAIDGEVADLSEDINLVDDDLADLDADLSEVTEEVAALDEDVVELDETVASAADEREELRGDIEGVRQELSEVGEELAAATEDLEGSITDLRGELGELETEMEEQDDAVASLESNLAEADEERSELKSKVDEDVAALREELDEVRAELEEVKQFRDRLSSVFAGPGGPMDEPAEEASTSDESEEDNAQGESDE